MKGKGKGKDGKDGKRMMVKKEEEESRRDTSKSVGQSKRHLFCGYGLRTGHFFEPDHWGRKKFNQIRSLS